MLPELRTRRLDHLAHQATQIRGLALDRQLARLNARYVQQLSDQPSQLVRLHLNRRSGAARAFGIGNLALVEFAREELGVAAQAGHRRLELVGRHGQELVPNAHRRARFTIQTRIVDGERAAAGDVLGQLQFLHTEEGSIP